MAHKTVGFMVRAMCRRRDVIEEAREELPVRDLTVALTFTGGGGRACQKSCHVSEGLEAKPIRELPGSSSESGSVR